MMRSAFYTKKPLKNFKYCIQRIRRGYCDADLCDMDSWFMSVIVPMLRQFDKTRFGWPTPIQEQYIEEHMAKYGVDRDELLCNYGEELEEVCNKKWSEILNKLADDFEMVNELEFSNKRGDQEKQEELKNKCFETFAKWFFYLWD